MSIQLILFILAAICFFLAAISPILGDRLGNINLLALGLFLWILGAEIIK